MPGRASTPHSVLRTSMLAAANRRDHVCEPTQAALRAHAISFCEPTQSVLRTYTSSFANLHKQFCEPTQAALRTFIISTLSRSDVLLIKQQPAPARPGPGSLTQFCPDLVSFETNSTSPARLGPGPLTQFSLDLLSSYTHNKPPRKSWPGLPGTILSRSGVLFSK